MNSKMNFIHEKNFALSKAAVAKGVNCCLENLLNEKQLATVYDFILYNWIFPSDFTMEEIEDTAEEIAHELRRLIFLKKIKPEDFNEELSWELEATIIDMLF